jgi:hypothetical protein
LAGVFHASLEKSLKEATRQKWAAAPSTLSLSGMIFCSLGRTRQGFKFGTRFHLPTMIRRQLQDVAMELEQGGTMARAQKRNALSAE